MNWLWAGIHKHKGVGDKITIIFNIKCPDLPIVAVRRHYKVCIIYNVVVIFAKNVELALVTQCWIKQVTVADMWPPTTETNSKPTTTEKQVIIWSYVIHNRCNL